MRPELSDLLLRPGMMSLGKTFEVFDILGRIAGHIAVFNREREQLPQSFDQTIGGLWLVHFGIAPLQYAQGGQAGMPT